MPQKIEISYKTILFTVGILLVGWLLYNMMTILMQLLVSFIIMTSLNSTVTKISQGAILRIKMNRLTAILLTYFIGIFIFLVFVLIIAQPLYTQTALLIQQLPELTNSFGSLGLSQSMITDQLSQIGALSGNIFRFVGAIFANIFNVVTTLVISFYLLLERERLHKHLVTWFANPKHETKIEKYIDSLEYQMGGWIRAQVLLMIIVGVMSTVVFSLLQIPYALPLGIIAGLLEIVPNIGPVIATVPAAIAGFSVYWVQGVGVVVGSFLIQQLENHIIVPQLMKRNVNVNPLVTIVSLLVGYHLAGVTGAILAIPVIIIIRTTIQEFFSDYFNHTQKARR